MKKTRSNMSRIECTPFCKSKPCEKHHDLLLAILNCPSEAKGKKVEKCGGFEEFEECVQKYLKKGWQKNDIVPDAVEDYQFPLVHWASVLGKLKALEWLTQNGFDPSVRAPKTKETALHRCILCLELSDTCLPRKALERKMEGFLDLLKDCLLLTDSDLDTPLHIAARQLLEGRKKDHFEDCIKLMLSKMKECFPDKVKEVLNAQNAAGDTAVHLLARSEDGFFALRTMINEGAITSLMNADGKTPIDVATELGSIRATMLLKKITNNTRTSTCNPTNESLLNSTTPSVNGDPVLPEDSRETSVNGVEVHITDKGMQTEPAADTETTQFSSVSLKKSHHPVCTCSVKKERKSRQNSQDNNPSNLFNSDQSGSALLDVLRGAGLWDNVKELAVKSRKEDEKCLTLKLEELQATNEAIEDADQVVGNTLEKISSSERELKRIKKELEDKKNELNYIKNEHQELKRKRGLLNNECTQLEKKLHYCDSLLKVNEPPQQSKNS